MAGRSVRESARRADRFGAECAAYSVGLFGLYRPRVIYALAGV